MLSTPSRTFPQTYDEILLPRVLSGTGQIDLFPSGGQLIHCVGFAQSFAGFPPDYFYGQENVYYLAQDSLIPQPSVAVSDTGSYVDEFFFGQRDEYLWDLDLPPAGVPLVAWSKQRRYFSDVPPFTDEEPTLHIGAISGSHFAEAAQTAGARNPRLATTTAGTHHLVWESLTPLYDTNYLFTRGTIRHALCSSSGIPGESDSIGAGFFPVAAAGLDDTLFVAWLHADSMNSRVWQLQYAKGTTGTFPEPVTLSDSLRYPRLLGVTNDRSGVIHIEWFSSTSSGFTSTYMARISPDGRLNEDSTPGANINFTIDSAGNEYAVWSTYDNSSKLNILWYSSSRSGPLFSTSHSIHSSRILTHYSVHVTSHGKPVVVINDSSKILYVRVNEGGVDDILPLPFDGAILDGRSVALGADNTIWFAYGRGRLYYSSIVDSAWLVRIEDPVLSVRPSRRLPEITRLDQNYPNPFNPSTSISFSLPKRTHVRLEVFNVLGQLVQSLVNVEKQPGTYNVTWDARNRPSGVYFYRMIAGEFRETRKAILTR
jgi:hypothetical protein